VFRSRLHLAVLPLVAGIGCTEKSLPEIPTRSPVTDGDQTRERAVSTARATSGEPRHEALPGPTLPAQLNSDVDPPARIHAKARFAWIQKAPRGSPGWIGYLSYGGSLPLRGRSVDAARVSGAKGCPAWYAVEPLGYVCAGDTATLDAADPAVVAMKRDAPRVDSAWPYEYGESHGTPRYPSIPTPEQQRRTEWDLDAHLEKVEKARRAEPNTPRPRALVGVDLSPAGNDAAELFPFGPLVRDERKFVALGSTVAYTRSFDLGGRTFLVTADQAIIPKDRVKPYPRSTFQGIELTEEALPLAFFRKTDRPKYKKNQGGAFEKTGESWARLDHVGLTGEKIGAGGRIYWATREPGIFVEQADASVVERSKPPFGDAGKGRRTWLDVSVLGGFLVAYEGEKPVFATLISPGRGGIPFDGIDPLETASTPTGTFRVDGKFVTATMVSSTNDEIVHSEVQFVQNFHGPHSLHGAYWHDAWGEPKSGGCINVSPIDAKRLFEWTEPTLPPGWHAIRSVAAFGNATWIVIRR
jgi:hypothetical protein